jgi:F-type H+-transporting ATPase subunit gamma
MPPLIDIRRRIRAVKSTQQITKAMKMIAASRLRKAHDRIVAARPFSKSMIRVLSSLAGRVDAATHPLLAARNDQEPGAHILLLVITADKGLAGGFNANVIRAAAQFIVSRPGQRVSLGLIGRKGRDFFRRRSYPVRLERTNLFARLEFNDAKSIAKPIIEDFVSGGIDAVYIVYNEFKSMISQKVVTERLLPVPRLGEDLAGQAAATGGSRGSNLDYDHDGSIDEGSQIDYLYEPDAQRIFDALLPQYVQYEVFHALLESAAAEHAARMTAMDAATNNAVEIVDSLTLYMNKVRQAAITREIIEVVSGAESL